MAPLGLRSVLGPFSDAFPSIFNNGLVQLTIVSVLILASVDLHLRWQGRRLPPSPPGIPIIGNITELTKVTYHGLHEMTRELGPIYSLRMFGSAIIVLGGEDAAHWILSRQSQGTAGRPPFIVPKYASGNKMLGALSGKLWQTQRRTADWVLRTNKGLIARIQNDSALALVKGLEQAKDSDEIRKLVRDSSAKTMLCTAYGPTFPDDAVQQLDEVAAAILEMFSPANAMFDLFALGMKLPYFQKRWDRFYVQANGLFTTMFDASLEFPDSLGYTLRHKGTEFNMGTDQMAWLCGMLLIGGAETSASALEFFVLAMVCHPHVAAKIQREIDELDMTELPTLDDRAKLPYLWAVVLEVLRWRPVAPIGIPHVATKDIPYGDYIIPEGSTIIYNLWSITHDRSRDTEHADEFAPERFLAEKRSDVAHHADEQAFGYGLRRCPGRTIAEAFLFKTAYAILKHLDVQLYKDENGNDIVPDDMKMEDTGASHRPAPYDHKFVARA